MVAILATGIGVAVSDHALMWNAMTGGGKQGATEWAKHIFLPVGILLALTFWLAGRDKDRD